MRKRTKPRVVWLPKDQTFSLANTTNVLSGIITVAGGAVGATATTGLIPVVIDIPGTAIGGLDTLSDIENSGYRLRRIVGKCFLSINQVSNNDAAGLWLIAAAFIILKVDSAGTPLDTTVAAYDLFSIDNDDSPWIWRREWILQNTASASAEDWPHTNAEYGSVADGPHIDQKTARIVSQNERLFFVASVINLEAGSGQVNDNIHFRVTPRVLASLRTSSGNRRNASR